MLPLSSFWSPRRQLHEKKTICGNCGGDKHCSDDHNCKETSKCANCNGPHRVFSRNCQTWKKEKQILSVKYKRSITFYEARKIIEEQLSARANSYASITKGAGKHVECIDAQTQTDETYNIQLKTTASGGDPPPRPGQNTGGGPPPAHQTNAGGKSRPHQNRQQHSSKKAQLQVLQVCLNLLTRRMRQNLKLILEQY